MLIDALLLADSIVSPGLLLTSFFSLFFTGAQPKAVGLTNKIMSGIV
jgi:hypothetical protein